MGRPDVSRIGAATSIYTWPEDSTRTKSPIAGSREAATCAIRLRATASSSVTTGSSDRTRRPSGAAECHHRPDGDVAEVVGPPVEDLFGLQVADDPQLGEPRRVNLAGPVLVAVSYT